MSQRVITGAELEPFLDGDDLAGKARALLAQQKESWELLRGGYASLDLVRTRHFLVDGFPIVLQFNPGRIRSSAAKVDAQSISERPCFLCEKNLPAEQRAVPFENDYFVLCNPYPISREHFTISRREHTPQRILENFPAMLRLSRAMGRLYTVFYNGPKCGASAPDHMHFQASERGFMPLDRDAHPESQRPISLREKPRLHATAYDGVRTMIILDASDESTLQSAFEAFYRAFQQLAPAGEEPMMNVITSCPSDGWRVIIFPRAKHRPSFFFLDESERLLLSPASVDIAGVCVTPMQRDFERVTDAHLAQMLEEVCLRGEPYRQLLDRFSAALTRI